MITIELKPALHSVLLTVHAFCHLIDVLVSKRPFSVMVKASTFRGWLTCCELAVKNVQIYLKYNLYIVIFKIKMYWTEAAQLYLIIHVIFREIT